MFEWIHTQVKRPIFFLRQHLSDRHFFIVSSILVGAASGLAAIVLKYFVHNIELLVRYSSRNYEAFLPFALFPLIGIFLTVLYIRFILKKDLKKGSAEIVYAILKKSSTINPRNIYAHLVSSGLTVGFGGSMGLESPMVSTGSAIGANYGVTYQLSYKDRTVLLGCGAAAGIAAAFNAPIAGVLFAIEVLLADVTASAFIPLIVAAASGALVSKIIMKEGIILNFTLQQPFDYHNTFFYIILGVACGLVALAYARIFSSIEERFSSIKNVWWRVLIGGIVLFALVMLWPPLYGEGYESIKALSQLQEGDLLSRSPLNSFMTTEMLILIFIGSLVFLKMIAAAVTMGSGGSGGSFAPSLFVGACLGYFFARLVNISKLASIPESNFTLVAMAGILSGVFYAPLTAIFLIAELTGGYELMIPLMMVAALSLLVAHFFQPLSMEGKRLANKLQGSIENRDKILLSRLDLQTLIETNFSIVRPDDNLAGLVNVIAKSYRNIFPVVDLEGKLVGLVYLDKIRNIIFDPNQYQKTKVLDLMTNEITVVEAHENLHQALLKFEQANHWNLPVVNNGKYMGFLSKSTILTKYRNELIATV
ncbi:MAG TPA: chloride channel protein [Chryseosolibacter sp.]|nr:chloride channel protein [Chryseosolibacter sp.]